MLPSVRAAIEIIVLLCVLFYFPLFLPSLSLSFTPYLAPSHSLSLLLAMKNAAQNSQSFWRLSGRSNKRKLHGRREGVGAGVSQGWR